MSGPNAARTLPPGDRDDAFDNPSGAGEDAPIAAAGREPQPDLFAEVRPTVDAIAKTIDEAQLAVGELRMAMARNDVPAIKAAAWRLSEALMTDLRGQSWSVRRSVIGRRSARRIKETAREEA